MLTIAREKKPDGPDFLREVPLFEPIAVSGFDDPSRMIHVLGDLTTDGGRRPVSGSIRIAHEAEDNSGCSETIVTRFQLVRNVWHAHRSEKDSQGKCRVILSAKILGKYDIEAILEFVPKNVRGEVMDVDCMDKYDTSPTHTPFLDATITFYPCPIGWNGMPVIPDNLPQYFWEAVSVVVYNDYSILSAETINSILHSCWGIETDITADGFQGGSIFNLLKHWGFAIDKGPGWNLRRSMTPKEFFKIFGHFPIFPLHRIVPENERVPIKASELKPGMIIDDSHPSPNWQKICPMDPFSQPELVSDKDWADWLANPTNHVLVTRNHPYVMGVVKSRKFTQPGTDLELIYYPIGSSQRNDTCTWLVGYMGIDAPKVMNDVL